MRKKPHAQHEKDSLTTTTTITLRLSTGWLAGVITDEPIGGDSVVSLVFTKLGTELFVCVIQICCVFLTSTLRQH